MEFDLFRFIEFVAVVLFGFVAYLSEVYKWTNNNITLTIIFGILFFVLLFMAGTAYKFVSDWAKNIKNDKKSARGGRKNA